MLLRLRSRDGLERVEVEDSATVAMLKQVCPKGLLLSGATWVRNLTCTGAECLMSSSTGIGKG